MLSTAARWAFATLLLLGAACTDDPGPSTYMVVRFGYTGDPNGSWDFVASAHRSSLLDSVRAELALPVDQRRFPNGLLRTAAAGENLGWHWAFDLNAWQLTDNSIELCDATPNMWRTTWPSGSARCGITVPGPPT